MSVSCLLSRSPLLLALMVGPLFGMVAIARSQSGTHSVVGKWSGEWITVQGGVERRGNYYLTIEKVEGNQVFGKGQIVDGKATDFIVKGTIDGNRFSWATVVLTVDGNIMYGRGRNQHRINLKKVK